MSYNIDSWDQVGGNRLRISKESADRLGRKFRDNRPGDWFLDDLEFMPDGCVDVDLYIRGNRSGDFFHEYIDEIAAVLEGEADFVLTWEEGAFHTGLRVSGGKAIEMDVLMMLVEKRGKR